MSWDMPQNMIQATVEVEAPLPDGRHTIGTGFLINDPALRSQPQIDAPIVLPLTTPDHSEGPDSATIDHVYGCSGAFADVETHMSKGPKKRGWATHICSNQVTTCV